ncbi:MAG: HAMP domain-containing histidine kinase [Firmicutes bacterium]|nr:HAMP domain-containing histidine kinase [Bacillota bacterium]
MRKPNTGGRMPVVFIILCAALFLLGSLTVYVGQYGLQKDLLETARQAAEEYAKTGTVQTDGFIHTSIMIFREGEKQELTYYEIPNHPQAHRAVARKLFLKHPSRTEWYTLHPYFRPLSLTAFARVNTRGPGGESTSIVLIRSIRYTGSILLQFLAVYGLAILFILGYMLQMRRMNRRVAEIYERYVANVSHELKSPIASIQVITETLSEGYVRDEAELARCYGIIDREARRLQHSVQDIIELSRIQDHRRDFTSRPVELRDLMEDALSGIVPQCEDLGISLETKLPDGPLTVRANPERVLQVLGILLDNAVKYTDAEGGSIHVAVKREKRSYAVCVSNSGPGIDPEDMPFIFERFYRGKNGGSISGSGLGLSIAWEIVQQMGEQLTAQSTPEEGTSFRFTLRRA